MGCGKSTAGKIAAEKLNCGFIDMDEYIVQKLGKSIPVIFAEKGEKYFREAETEAIKELAEKKCVIACGGGAMLKSENAEIARCKGKIIFIDVDFEICYSRIKNGRNRPIVNSSTKDELEIIYESRVPVYSTNSDATICGEGTPDEVADRIAAEMTE